MRVLIPAAGMGSRLGAGVPKILVNVGGVSILDRHLRSLSEMGLSPERVTVVTGFEGELLRARCRALGVSTVHNPDWRNPGTYSSLHLLPPSGEDLLVLHGDLLWEGGLVEPLLDKPGDILLPVDPRRRTDAEAMKAEVRGSLLLHLSKELPRHRSAGESMGVFLLRRHRRFREISAGLLDTPEASIDDGLNLAAGRMDIRVRFLSGEDWEEVDTPEDLERAEVIFRGR